MYLESKSVVVESPSGEMMVNPPKNHRILYVEDHADTVEMVKLMLEANGFEVRTHSTLADGIAAAAGQKFDLYLLDLWLPDGSGMDLCKRIRQFDSTTPIVFYSAAAYEMDKDAAMESGAQAYLTKPTDSISLVENLVRILNQDGHGSGEAES